MKASVSFTFIAVFAVILLGVLFIATGQAKGLSEILKFEWIKDIASLRFGLAHHIGDVPGIDIGYNSFSGSEDYGTDPEGEAMYGKYTSTHAACEIAKAIRDDFEKYGTEKEHGKKDSDFQSVAQFSDYANSEVIASGTFRIKLKVCLDDISDEELKGIGQENKKVEWEASGKVITINGKKYIDFDEVKKLNIWQGIPQEKITYWKFEDLPSGEKDNLKKFCSNLDPPDVKPCGSEYLDEECVAKILSGLRIPDNIGGNFICTGINSKPVWTGSEQEKEYFGDTQYKVPYNQYTGHSGVVSGSGICTSGESEYSDMISKWKAYGSIDLAKEGIYAEYQNFYGEDISIGDYGYPPYLADASMTQKKEQPVFQWILFWDESTKKYQVLIARIPVSEYSEYTTSPAADTVPEDSAADKLTDDIVEYFYRKPGSLEGSTTTIPRKMPISNKEFRIKWHKTVKLDKSIRLEDFWKELENKINSQGQTYSFKREECSGRDDCLNYGIYKLVFKVELEKGGWGPWGESPPTTMKIRSPLLPTDIIKAREYYEIALFQYEKIFTTEIEWKGCKALEVCYIYKDVDWKEEGIPENKDTGQPHIFVPKRDCGAHGIPDLPEGKNSESKYCSDVGNEIRHEGYHDFTLVIVPLPPPDSDFDGMTDEWETFYIDGYNKLHPNEPIADLTPNDDLDSDGLTNLDEYEYGTDPANSDTDGDKMKDGEEVAAGKNPLVPNEVPTRDSEIVAADRYGTSTQTCGSKFFYDERDCRHDYDGCHIKKKKVKEGVISWEKSDAIPLHCNCDNCCAEQGGAWCEDRGLGAALEPEGICKRRDGYGKCCPIGSHASNGHCCPEGTTYNSGTGMCEY